VKRWEWEGMPVVKQGQFMTTSPEQDGGREVVDGPETERTMAHLYRLKISLVAMRLCSPSRHRYPS